MEQLNENNYYSKEANIEYMSVSQYKDFEQCEFYGLMKALGEFEEEKGKPLLMGGYADAHFSNRLDKFKSENPQIFKKDGSLLKDYEKVEECIKVAESDDLFLSRTKGEKQVIVAGKINDVKVKGCIDFLNEDGIDDLKLVASITEPVWVERNGRNVKTNFIDAYGYDVQGAVYQELARQTFHKELPFNVLPISKEDYPDIAIINIPNDILKEKLEEFASKIKRYDLIKKGIIEPTHCGHCPCCRKYKKLDHIVNYKEFYNIGEENGERKETIE